MNSIFCKFVMNLILESSAPVSIFRPIRYTFSIEICPILIFASYAIQIGLQGVISRAIFQELCIVYKAFDLTKKNSTHILIGLQFFFIFFFFLSICSFFHDILFFCCWWIGAALFIRTIFLKECSSQFIFEAIFNNRVEKEEERTKWTNEKTTVTK